MSNRRYTRAIARGLDRALARAVPRTLDPSTDRVIVFSDLHRGQGDHADDFRHAADTYRRALEFYLDAGFILVSLGDAEELWEGWPSKVIPHYREILELEARFRTTNPERLIKIWGNHDDLWQYPHQITKHLSPIYGDVVVPEAVLVTVDRDEGRPGRLLLAHGHQGTGSSDRWGAVSRFAVRWVWRPIQRLFKVSLNTPATDFEIRGKHDRAMYEWAAARTDLILIAGHTHNPVFVSLPHVATLERVHDHLCESPDCASEARAMDREIGWARDQGHATPAVDPTRDRGCYFNSGCCCFSNGDITGIELADGEIRLVRWTAAAMEPDERVLESHPLESIFVGLEGR